MKAFINTLFVGMNLVFPFSINNYTITHHPIIVKKQIVRGNLKALLSRISKIESDNNDTASNRFGALGRYQFKLKTLKELGITESREEFLHNRLLQDSAMILFMKDNKQSLRKVIKQFSGTYYKGIWITQSGILAAAHLVGPGGVLSFFYPENERWSKFKTADANGTTIDLYLKTFANYRIIGI